MLPHGAGRRTAAAGERCRAKDSAAPALGMRAALRDGPAVGRQRGHVYGTVVIDAETHQGRAWYRAQASLNYAGSAVT
ncbi:hypothetical protein [Streptomyces coerulescens]|uniref:Uncharacterized protein n=1 Tax=Streptomyces coerulescens TaxID=29304 RepID=A0ABW0CWY0_STRCD